MTTPLTKAERDELRRLHNAATPAPWNGDWDIVTDDGDQIARTDVSLASDPDVADNDGPLIVAARNALPRLLDDLDAAEARVRTQFQATFDELRRALGDDIGSEGGLCAILTGIESIQAQRDRAESELDAERKLRVEAEAAAQRAEAERDALKAKLAALLAEIDHAHAEAATWSPQCECALMLAPAIAAARGAS